MGRHPVEAGLSTSKAMLALILLPVVTWASPVVGNPSVDLAVYFESLCPDSIKFVSRDVPAAWRLFGPDLRISFKPFGKASWSHHDPDRILGCANGGEGADLLFELGVETKSLDPPLLWVPWTTFNGVYIESEWNAAIDDLTGFLCSSYLAGHP